MTRAIRLGLLLAGLATIPACGKYPDSDASRGGHGAHEKASSVRPGQAELTGRGYRTAFLKAGYRTKDVTLAVREETVDVGGGYRYRALTYDGNFPARTLVVEQGTLVRIRLENRGREEHSLHTHVIKYKPESDGTATTAAKPGETRYFFWEVTEETPAGFYPFHDHGGAGEGGLARGLIGMVHVVERGKLADAEKGRLGFGILLHDLDPAYLFSSQGAPPPRGGGEGGHGGHGGGGRRNTGMPETPMHLINGRYGADPRNTFTVPKGGSLRVGVVNLGVGIHSFHPHGNTYLDEAGRVGDMLELQPGAYRTVELRGETPGEWTYHCHVPGHPEGGMVSRYFVR